MYVALLTLVLSTSVHAKPGHRLEDCLGTYVNEETRKKPGEAAVVITRAVRLWTEEDVIRIDFWKHGEVRRLRSVSRAEVHVSADRIEFVKEAAAGWLVQLRRDRDTARYLAFARARAAVLVDEGLLLAPIFPLVGVTQRDWIPPNATSIQSFVRVDYDTPPRLTPCEVALMQD